jgi:pimeloyl-ACP methyl ester carboxylesterase
MFKKLKLLVIFLFLLFSPKTATANEWLRFSNNPLTINYAIPPEQELYRLQSFVFLDENRFKMWFVSLHDWPLQKIYFTSSAEGVSWDKAKEIEINTSLPIHDPMVLKEGDNYWLYFAADQKENGDKKMAIYRAISSDGQKWVLNPNQPVLKWTNSGWKSNWVTAPHVIKDNGLYKMWYTGYSNRFALGLATSTDGVNWTDSLTNPILNDADGPCVVKNGSVYELYYQKGALSGRAEIHRLSSNNAEGWENDVTVIKSANFYEENNLSPSVVEFQNNRYLFYTGLLSSVDRSYFNLATEKPLNLKNPVIVIPGFFGSWNKEAILHNQSVAQNQWSTPKFVQEYNGLLQTLKNVGYRENEDLFIFNYDWRQSLDKTLIEFSAFLKEKTWSNPTLLPVKIIGHSLGGLIGRLYTQDYPERVRSLVTVGSPHQGIVQVYKPLSAGEVERNNTLMWLAEKIVLVLNRADFSSDKAVINNLVPSLYDLLPTFDYLKNENNEWIAFQKQPLQNQLLLKYNPNFSQIFSQFLAIYGKNSSQNTPAGFLVSQKTNLDYPNGQPLAELFGFGDGVVLENSAQQIADNDGQNLNLDHGQLIANKQGIVRILTELQIPYNEADLVEGKTTDLTKALIFLIQSPAKLSVELDETTYPEEAGLIFIENPKNGNYHLKVEGKAEGSYTVFIGQINSQQELWETVSGQTKTLQVDNYLIKYLTNGSLQTVLPTASPIPSPKESVVAPTTNQTSSAGYFTTQFVKKQPTILGLSTSKKNLSQTTPTLTKPFSLTKSKIFNYFWFATISFSLIAILGWLIKIYQQQFVAIFKLFAQKINKQLLVTRCKVG